MTAICSCAECGQPRIPTARTIADCVLKLYPMSIADAKPGPSPRALLGELRTLAGAVLAEQARVCLGCFRKRSEAGG